MNNRILKLLIGLFFIVTSLQATTIKKSLYINRGLFTTVHKTTFPWVVFNSSTAFNQLNTVITLSTKDTLILKVINNDTTKHGFAVKEYANLTPTEISPSDSATYTLHFTSEGVFIYYDSYQYPKYKYLGAAGIIAVNNSSVTKNFYWNVKEHQSDYNIKLANNLPVDWASYQPDYFTYNGMSYPDILDDTVNTWIHGHVGDTLRIFIANTGQASHGVHFHGFHGKIIYSAHSEQMGWIKDTFPLKRMEAIVIEMVPDKVGYYTIHDHNLINNTGASIYLRGMLSIMTIQ